MKDLRARELDQQADPFLVFLPGVEAEAMPAGEPIDLSPDDPPEERPAYLSAEELPVVPKEIKLEGKVAALEDAETSTADGTASAEATDLAELT